ncbi:hypothetical protein LINGRAPRIM_LOCUS2603 [Linum grandiflorum]
MLQSVRQTSLIWKTRCPQQHQLTKGTRQMLLLDRRRNDALQ